LRPACFAVPGSGLYKMLIFFYLVSPTPPMKKIILLVLALANFYQVLADTFTVTSNADSGPGTLREAITLANANGTTVADMIVFNITDITETGRTINLQTELPALSSHITIDGSTQPGGVLGISTAKITLFLDHFTSLPFSFIFIQQADNVKIFGLCFRFFYEPDVGGGENYGICLRNSSNITVGAPGKGNLFTYVRGSIVNHTWNYYTDSVRDVTIQSNVFGLNSSSGVAHRGFINLNRAANIIIGGPAPGEGNVFAGAGVFINQSPNTAHSFFVQMQNNRFNMDWTGTTYYTWETINITLWGNITDDTTTTKTFILDNAINCSPSGGIGLNQLYHKAIVTGNKLGTDITGTTCKSPTSIGFYGCKSVRVGGYTLAEQNIISGNAYTQKRGIHFIRNEFGSIMMSGASIPADPYVKMLTYDNGLITGKANPSSKIQLYTNGCMNGCTDKKYLATVYADAAGDWSFPYTAAMPNIVATATTPDSATSEFSGPKVNHSNFVIKHATCGKSNGSITGIVIQEGTHIMWQDGYTGQVISTDTNLLNVPAGYYSLTVTNGANGCKWGINLSVSDVAPPPVIGTSIKHASCGQNNGIIVSQAAASLSYKWMNANNDSIGNNYFINKLPPGTYYLKAWIPYDTSCNKTYGPYVVQNLSGPSLAGTAQITNATCSQANGSITGITATNVTGTPFIQWVDSLNRPAGNDYDLVNIRPGKYRFKFKDASSCDTIITPWYQVPDIGAVTIGVTSTSLRNAFCGMDNGLVRVNTFNKDSNLYTFRWVNEASGLTIGSGTALYNLPEGKYLLYATDPVSGCEKNIFSASIGRYAAPSFDYSKALLQNDECQQHLGSISGIQVTGLAGPTVYAWYNQNADVVSNSPDLRNAGPGTYVLKVTDGIICTFESRPFTITNRDVTPASPVYDNLSIPKNTNASLSIKNPLPGTYRLYADAAGTVLLQENTSGNFIVTNLKTDADFYIQRITGTCSAPPVKVHVTVVDRSFFAIPTAFTPNGDGLNDRLPIRVIGRLEIAYFRIYNRWGQIVFESSRQSDGWDGLFKGQLQASGTYVWVAEGKDLLGHIIRDKGSFVLIR
jgi:gliding motility-associated-like protein